MHGRIATNNMLYYVQLIDNPEYEYCNEKQMPMPFSSEIELWNNFTHWLKELRYRHFRLGQILFGEREDDKLVNLKLMIGKLQL